MNLSQKQQRELRILRWYIPSNCEWGYITKGQIADFFAWSDTGKSHGRNVLTDRDGFCALYWAKNRRDLQITSYLEDWGETMNAWSFTGIPRLVKQDIAKRMNKLAIMGASA